MRTAGNLHDALTLAGHTTVNGAALADAAVNQAGWPTSRFVSTVAGLVRLDFTAAATTPQKDAAVTFTLAFDWSDAAQLAADKLAYRPLAIARITAAGALEALARAHVDTEIDELNILRDWITQFKAAVAAASTLADLKTRVAALPNTPARTLTQYRTTMTAKINAGTED